MKHSMVDPWTFEHWRQNALHTWVQRVQHHYDVFRDLVSLAESFSNRQPSAAAAFAQMAGDYAWFSHTGLFRSAHLEGILQSVGRAISPSLPGRRPSTDTVDGLPGHVLHVLTQAYGVGGHTRLVWRWIRRDSERRHSVALTNQGSFNVPRALSDAAAATGGHVYQLDSHRSDILSRAVALREVARRADLVVLHVHPSDTVPLMSFANGHRRTPVLFLNHADHVFWLGCAVSDVIVNIRTSGDRLAKVRRAIDPSRCAVLPIPLDPIDRTHSRAEAKRLLGLPDDAVLVLSVGSWFKYRGSFSPSFPQAVRPVLDKHENAVLWVVGPEERGEWEVAARQSHGRVRAWGEREDTPLFYQAADIFVNSFPMSESLTALLEAGSYGVPLVSYCPYGTDSAVLGADDPALDGNLRSVEDLGSLQAVLSDLIADHELRASVGERTRASVLQVHAGPSWTEELKRVYLRAAAGPVIDDLSPSPEVARPSIGLLDALLAYLNVSSGTAKGLDARIQSRIRYMPLRVRLRLWGEACKSGPSLATGILFSEDGHRRLRGRVRRALGTRYVNPEHFERGVRRLARRLA